VDPDSSVVIATHYGLNGPGIESRWGRDFPHPSRPALRPKQPPIQWVPSLSSRVKRPGRGLDHPHPYSAEVKERVKLYLYSPSGPSWPVLVWSLPLPAENNNNERFPVIWFSLLMKHNRQKKCAIKNTWRKQNTLEGVWISWCHLLKYPFTKKDMGQIRIQRRKTQKSK